MTIAAAIALGIVGVAFAFAAWDVGRRWNARRYTDDVLARLTAESVALTAATTAHREHHDAELVRIRGAVDALKERNDNQIKNALKEVRELVAAHDAKMSGVVAMGSRFPQGIRGATKQG